MNRKGNTVLSNCFARGYRDGFSGHAPRSDARSYRRGYADGQQDRRYTSEWMHRGLTGLQVRPSEASRIKFGQLPIK
jgi:hypothetical protein